MLFNGYFFITKQYEILQAQIEDSKKTFVESKRNVLKREVDAIIEFIEPLANSTKQPSQYLLSSIF